jgi:hypothetical protein
MAALVSVGGARVAHAQLELDRLELFLRTGAGAPRGTFAIRNSTDTARTVRVALEDWRRTPDGVTHSDSLGRLPGSCGPSVTIFPTTLRLNPRESQPVRVDYTGPARTTSCWVIAWVEAAPVAPPRGGATQVTINLVQGVKIYVEPAGARPQLDLREVTLARRVPLLGGNPADTIGQDVAVLVANPGTIQSRARARIEYRTAADSVAATVRMDEFPILPGATRLVRSRVPVLRPGAYVAIVFLDYGGPEILAGQVRVDVRR